MRGGTGRRTEGVRLNCRAEGGYVQGGGTPTATAKEQLCMVKLLTPWTAPVILAVTLACTAAIPVPGPTQTSTPKSIVATLVLLGNTPGPEATGATPAPTSKPETPPAPASISPPTTSPTPGTTAAPTPFTEPTGTPEAEPAPEGITPILLELPQSLESEVPDSELACLAGTADAGKVEQNTRWY